jgi:hypothetical protein
MFALRPDALPDHHQPELHRRPRSWRDPLREHDGPPDRGARFGRVPLGREAGRFLSEGRQGFCDPPSATLGAASVGPPGIAARRPPVRLPSRPQPPWGPVCGPAVSRDTRDGPENRGLQEPFRLEGDGWGVCPTRPIRRLEKVPERCEPALGNTHRRAGRATSLPRIRSVSAASRAGARSRPTDDRFDCVACVAAEVRPSPCGSWRECPARGGVAAAAGFVTTVQLRPGPASRLRQA